LYILHTSINIGTGQNRGRPPNPIPNPISNPKSYPNPIPNPKPYPNPIPNPKPNPKCYRNRVRWSPTVLPRHWVLVSLELNISTNPVPSLLMLMYIL